MNFAHSGMNNLIYHFATHNSCHIPPSFCLLFTHLQMGSDDRIDKITN